MIRRCGAYAVRYCSTSKGYSARAQASRISCNVSVSSASADAVGVCVSNFAFVSETGGTDVAFIVGPEWFCSESARRYGRSISTARELSKLIGIVWRVQTKFLRAFVCLFLVRAHLRLSPTRCSAWRRLLAATRTLNTLTNGFSQKCCTLIFSRLGSNFVDTNCGKKSSSMGAKGEYFVTITRDDSTRDVRRI